MHKRILVCFYAPQCILDTAAVGRPLVCLLNISQLPWPLNAGSHVRPCYYGGQVRGCRIVGRAATADDAVEVSCRDNDRDRPTLL